MHENGFVSQKSFEQRAGFPRVAVEMFARVILPELYHGCGGDSEIDVWKSREAKGRFRENRCEARTCGHPLCAPIETVSRAPANGLIHGFVRWNASFIDGSGLKPWRILPCAEVQNTIFSVPMSEQEARFKILQEQVPLYRLPLGHPNQEDLHEVLHGLPNITEEQARAAWLRLSP
jgi:hypothetical protein